MKVSLNLKKRYVYSIASLLIIIVGVVLVNAYTDSSGVGHDASQVGPGTLGAGDYIFPTGSKVVIGDDTFLSHGGDFPFQIKSTFGSDSYYYTFGAVSDAFGGGTAGGGFSINTEKNLGSPGATMAIDNAGRGWFFPGEGQDVILNPWPDSDSQVIIGGTTPAADCKLDVRGTICQNGVAVGSGGSGVSGGDSSGWTSCSVRGQSGVCTTGRMKLDGSVIESAGGLHIQSGNDYGSSSDHRLHLNPWADDVYVGAGGGSGKIHAKQFLYFSDENLKQNIQPISSAVDKVSELEGVSFEWKESGEQSIGVVAQDVEKVFPESVSTNEEGLKSVQYGNLVAVLIEAIKEQQAQINELEKEIEELKN